MSMLLHFSPRVQGVYILCLLYDLVKIYVPSNAGQNSKVKIIVVSICHLKLVVVGSYVVLNCILKLRKRYFSLCEKHLSFFFKAKLMYKGIIIGNWNLNYVDTSNPTNDLRHIENLLKIVKKNTKIWGDQTKTHIKNNLNLK